MSWKAKRDPPIRKDGRCSACGKPRPEMAMKEHDPFCSTECAKRWHGVVSAGGKQPPPAA